jgi:ribulose-phosphate 3-epimerase
MKKITIVPAIISDNQEGMDFAISKVNNAKRIQLDVMDGKFVNNTSLNFNINPPKIKGLYEAHLMVADPKAWIEENHDKVDIIIPHYSAMKDNIVEIIDLIKSKGKIAAISINPEISISDIEQYLPTINQLLVMTVHPGFYGSKFVPEALEKVKQARELFPDIDIEVDGGMNLENTKLAKQAGANVIVSGSFIMKSEDPEKQIEVLENV